jgi:hypothetical protein
LIEVAAPQVRLLPEPYLELSPLQGADDVYPTSLEPSRVILAQTWVNDVKRAFTALDALGNKWHEHTIFLVR